MIVSRKKKNKRTRKQNSWWRKTKIMLISSIDFIHQSLAVYLKQTKKKKQIIIIKEK